MTTLLSDIRFGTANAFEEPDDDIHRAACAHARHWREHCDL